eukprot:361251-Chlamydomonas_euryale.AAC.1
MLTACCGKLPDSALNSDDSSAPPCSGAGRAHAANDHMSTAMPAGVKRSLICSARRPRARIAAAAAADPTFPPARASAKLAVAHAAERSSLGPNAPPVSAVRSQHACTSACHAHERGSSAMPLSSMPSSGGCTCARSGAKSARGPAAARSRDA